VRTAAAAAAAAVAATAATTTTSAVGVVWCDGLRSRVVHRLSNARIEKSGIIESGIEEF
jgi:hypothetical protein